MKRTTIFLTDELDHLLREAARRTGGPRAEIMREALAQYLSILQRPRPRSIGMGKDTGPEVTSENVKDWVREQWYQEADAHEREVLRPR